MQPSGDDNSSRLFERAQALMPGGVNSPVRAFRRVGGVPRFIRQATGCHLQDVDHQKYIDYVGSWGAMIAGHAHPKVLEALHQVTARGTSFGMPSPLEVDLAAEICTRIPSMEKIRMVNSGTEAVMSAIRLARAVTGRTKIVKFEGCYHGHCDALLAKAGSGVATFGLPDSPGVPPGAARDTLCARYNDLEHARTHFDNDGPDIAAVIVEPVAGNMGVVPPSSGFLAGLRELTREHGALLIFDEVITGFRIARGGAQELYRVEPDITTLGKIIGGGLPVGAYGGPVELMDHLAPLGAVYQAGTLSGNPLAMAAGLATLRLLDAQAYQQLERRAAELQKGLSRIIREKQLHACVQRVGSMLTLFFDSNHVYNLDDAEAADHHRFADFFQAMLRQGIHLPPSGYEAWFLSLAHDQQIIQFTLQCAQRSL